MDDWIMETVRNMKKAQIAMDVNDQDMFNFVRKVTEETRKFKLYAKDLLSHNKEFFHGLPRLKELLEHYSWWQTSGGLTYLIIGSYNIERT
jgi:hypothetical protein